MLRERVSEEKESQRQLIVGGGGCNYKTGNALPWQCEEFDVSFGVALKMLIAGVSA